MSPGEQLVLNDANEFIRQTANLIDEAEQSTGIRPHPVIEESETVLETSRFGMQFGPEPLAEATDSTSSGGVTCPSTITLTYHDIVFDCGCRVANTGQSLIITDNDLSGRSVTLSRITDAFCASTFGWGVNGVDYCSYAGDAWSGTGPLHYKGYDGEICGGAPVEELDVFPFPRVLMLSGVWYVWDIVETGVGDAAIFIATTSNPNVAINNAMICEAARDRSGNPIIDCHGPNLIGGVPVVPGVSHGGYVTITF